MKLLVSALEPSANLHLKELLNELRIENEKCRIEGVFDS